MHTQNADFGSIAVRKANKPKPSGRKEQHKISDFGGGEAEEKERGGSGGATPTNDADDNEVHRQNMEFWWPLRGSNSDVRKDTRF